LKRALKILPFLIGITILQGITSAAAQCSYVGVAVGDTYDFTLSGTIDMGGVHMTMSGNMHVKIDNITAGPPCRIGITVTGMSGFVFGPSFTNGTVTMQDSTSISSYSSTGLFVSINVVNKTYFSKTSSSSSSSMIIVKWDSNGVLLSIIEDADITTYGGTHEVIHEEFTRVGGSTPGPDSFILFGLFILGIAIIILKKRGISREPVTAA
jgi:hypothetical protein